MTLDPIPVPHKDHAKKSPAKLLEVTRWVARALEHERSSGIGEFLTPVIRDFRGIKSICADDIPDDPLRTSVVVTLHSGQQYRITIEEK